jgi:hypothetical protein
MGLWVLVDIAGVSYRLPKGDRMNRESESVVYVVVAAVLDACAALAAAWSGHGKHHEFVVIAVAVVVAACFVLSAAWLWR